MVDNLQILTNIIFASVLTAHSVFWRLSKVVPGAGAEPKRRQEWEGGNLKRGQTCTCYLAAGSCHGEYTDTGRSTRSGCRDFMISPMNTCEDHKGHFALCNGVNAQNIELERCRKREREREST